MPNLLYGNLPIFDLNLETGTIHVCFCPECGWRAYSPTYAILKMAYTVHDIFCWDRRAMVELPPKKPVARETRLPRATDDVLMQSPLLECA